MKFLFLMFTNILLILGSISPTQAACTSYLPIGQPGYDINPISKTVTLPAINVQKNTPVGSVVATTSVDARNSGYVGFCPRSGGYVYYNMTYLGGVTTGISNVYKTNVTGIGIRAQEMTYFNNPAGKYNTYALISGGPWTMNYFTVDLVVTGPVSPGVIKKGEIGYVSFDGTPSVKSATLTLGSDVAATSTGCSLKTQSINIKLDDISDAELVSVGTTAKLKNFDIGLDCEANARVNVKLTGTQNPDTTAAGVLKLTNAGSAGVAKGVGIQMLYDNKPMTVNQNVLLKTSAGGLETFTFGAQYYQTKAAVSGGSANATATLDITYQ
ncbi:fimbrial protein [Rahnella sp. Larv3_ips]|uniref:fimbrial protein n=1 Tax=Rahnella sp. Larv3_ips TaxID=1896943 RepID=UPI000EFA7053|nr:fimbrial protein [Rahnella sp. Larv3_ips]